jgi:hypothetical protein
MFSGIGHVLIRDRSNTPFGENLLPPSSLNHVSEESNFTDFPSDRNISIEIFELIISNREHVHVTYRGCTCGLLELNSGITAICIDERDVTKL